MPGIRNNFEDLTGAIRRGGVQPSGDTVSADNPIWVEFARSMVPMMIPAAHAIADLIDASSAPSMKVLDIAASHGVFGITIAQRNPRAEVVAFRGQLESAGFHGVSAHAIPTPETVLIASK
ncbi:MAG TPA: hypothetical protein VKH42_14335 [Vicinamibacterales bacterium]|nr:hypothetical protein [Vicinamibacterales bacterium]